MSDGVDVNASLFRWPFRNVGVETADALCDRLHKAGIGQAWVGSLEGIFQRDVTACNERLAEACQSREAMLVPFGTINPALPDWQEDLRRCDEVHRMPGIRLHPAYHGYRLDDEAFAALLQAASERGLIVQLVVAMEDERTEHPVFRVEPLDLSPLGELLPHFANLRLLLLNAWRRVPSAQAVDLAARGEVYFELATLEGVDRLAALAEQMPVERILFGTHFPLFYPEGSQLKLRESALPASVLRKVHRENALRLLARE